jgi:hypothetical protein
MPEPSEITVFLSFCSDGQANMRNELAQTLLRAGMNVVNLENISGSVTAEQVDDTLKRALCSIHILFADHGPLTAPGSTSLAAFQFDQAKKKLETDPAFRLFAWHPPSTIAQSMDPAQAAFITDMRNSIAKNMVFSNAGSALQLVDDIRTSMESTEEVLLNVNATDIFLISNQLDENEANDIIDMLSDILPVEKLNIIQDSDIDYSELCKQQIAKSKLAVIYFKETAEWAIPFAQQVWKKIGGATSHTPILLIGDEDPETNVNKKFKAPKVISLIISGELIPLEIKVQFDKVKQTGP